MENTKRYLILIFLSTGLIISINKLGLWTELLSENENLIYYAFGQILAYIFVATPICLILSLPLLFIFPKKPENRRTRGNYIFIFSILFLICSFIFV